MSYWNATIASFLLAMVTFAGCDSKSTAPDDDSSSSTQKQSSTSTAKYVCEIYNLSDALRCGCDESREGKLSYNYDSNVELVCIYDEYLNKWG